MTTAEWNLYRFSGKAVVIFVLRYNLSGYALYSKNSLYNYIIKPKFEPLKFWVHEEISEANFTALPD